MRVWADRTAVLSGEVTRTECELIALHPDGAAELRGGDWRITGFTGALYDSEGALLEADALRAGLITEAGQALYDQLAASGALNEFSAVARIVRNLLAAMRESPLLRAIAEAAEREA